VEYERGAAGRGEQERAHRLIDRRHPVAGPAEEASAEVAELDGTLALGDQGGIAEAYLDARVEGEFVAAGVVLP